MMINRKDTPAPSSMQRGPPPPHSLSLRPASQSNSADSANNTPQTPQTPKNKVRSKRASKVQRPTPRETHTEGNARAAADENNIRDERISHDLSLTDNTRHSVVDNMLMSLNPDQSKLFSFPKDRPTFSSGSESTVPPPQPPQSAHRHLHSSSTNSDLSFISDNSPQRFSTHLPRGRRSNSSSNFQPGLSRIDSVHAERETGGATKGETHAPGTGAGEAPRALRTTRKHSKSSGSSSVDLGHMGPFRLPHTHSRRSASFDLSERARALHSASSASTHPSISNSLPQSHVYNDLEAAPTPTVPAGPRKDRTPLFPPNTAPSAPMPQRRNSNKSSKSQAAKRKKNEDQTWEPPIPVPADAPTIGSRRASKQVAPNPSFLKVRNHSPIRQHSEPLMVQRLAGDAPVKEPTIEKPGFFRRMFGSSRNDMHLLQTQNTKGSTRAASREEPHPTQKPSKLSTLETAPQSDAPPLVKKPSSFFRRRKKSVSEAAPPPMLPLHLNSKAPQVVETAQRSPTSSLRQVMNPYLDNPVRSDARQFAGTAGHDIGPSQTHTLTAKGSTDPARIEHDPMQDAGFNSPLRQPRDIPSSRRDLSTERARLRPAGTSFSKVHDNSFLHDDSSNETRIHDTLEDTELQRRGTVNLDQAPTSITAAPTPRKDSVTKSKEGREPIYERLVDRTADSTLHRDVLSTRDANMPPSPHTTPTKPDTRDWLTSSQVTPASAQPSPATSTKGADRVWLQPGGFDSNVRKQDALKRDMAFPVDNPEVSPVSDYQSASSKLQSLQSLRLKDDIHFPEPTTEDVTHKLSVEVDDIQPTEAERQQAKQFYEGDETLVPKSMVGPWLGDPDPSRGRIRQAYMEFFDWQNLNILAALRSLCDKLYLKGEAQQLDRVLDAFSTRWCACNPNHGFKATDVIHTMCYSLIMLNTDLHQAGVETKMTRTQFLKNILPTIRRVVTDAAPDAFVNPRASTLPPPKPWAASSRASIILPASQEAPEPRRSFEGQRPIYRLSQRPSDQTAYSTQPHTPIDFNTASDCGPLVKVPFHGKLSTWENQMEIILKEFYNSIRQQRLPLHGTDALESVPETPRTGNSFSAMTTSMLRRTPSVLSKTGSENVSYSRGRANDGRLGTGRWQSKNRSRPRLYPASSVGTSRRSSLDEGSSMTSPSVTSAWSKFSSLGKTQTSLSINSFASQFPSGDYQQSIGFANALSQAIIREEGAGGDEESLRAAPMLEDESLELAGAPWAKEGNLKHKHHLDGVDKKARDRNWAESFAVIEKGYMRLFSFNMNAKSLRQKTKAQKAAGGVVGGGNWADSAETLGTFLLRQTIAIALPPPGYSKLRPHVWALNLPTGAVHLFQVGTPEIVKEFVTTANYWSARLSKEPMVGGISNIEYGWGDSVINTALLNPERNVHSSAGTNCAARPSLQSSIRSARSSIDQGAFRPRLPGDKVVISDWTPPQQSMVASVLMEVDQLKGLCTYVRNIEEELERHNELRAVMLLAFSPRHPNSTKAMTNWERKSSYLLHEIVKFKTYIDVLESANRQKERIYAERATKGMSTPTGEVTA